MNIIPNVIPYIKGELLYEYILKLAKVNGFDNLREFYSLYIFEDGFFTKSYASKYIVNLEDSLNVKHEDFYKLYLDTTLYDYYSKFLDPSQQTMYLNNVLRKYNPESKLNKNEQVNIIRELHFCPQCKKEEIESDGTFYFHREHQIPGVKVCSKHGCILHKYDDIYTQELKIECKSEPLKLSGDLDAERILAEFTHTLLESDIDTNAVEINDIVMKELKRRNLTFEHFNEYMKCSKLKSLYSFNTYESLVKSSVKLSEENTIEKDIPIILYELFETVERIPFTKKQPSKEWLDLLAKEDYELVSSYKENYLSIRHKECNTVYITTAQSFTNGWRCPVCDFKKTDTEIFKKVVENSHNHEYEMTNDFVDWMTKINVKHLRCGRSIDVRPRLFLQGKKLCTCGSMNTFEKVKSLVERLGTHKLLSYDPQTNIALIRNNKCYHKYETTPGLYLSSQKCPICSINTDTRESFIEEMKKLVGDEYELIGDYVKNIKTQKVKILHKTCNEITKMNPRYFLQGQRCPHCTKQIPFKDFKDYVYKISGGRYICTPHKDAKTKILDTQTG